MNHFGNGMLSSFFNDSFKSNILIRVIILSLITGTGITCLIHVPFIGVLILMSTPLVGDAFPELADIGIHIGTVMVFWIYLKSFFAWFVYTTFFSLGSFPFYLFREIYLWLKTR